MAGYYYAIFDKEEDGFLVTFPDLKGCNTFGETMENAIEMAEDALAGWLESAQPQFIKEPSSYEVMAKHFTKKNELIMQVKVRRDLMLAYAPKKKVNLSLSVKTVQLIDLAAQNAGLNRSEFIDGLATSNIKNITLGCECQR